MSEDSTTDDNFLPCFLFALLNFFPGVEAGELGGNLLTFFLQLGFAFCK